MTARWRLQVLAEMTVGTALRQQQQGEVASISRLRAARAARYGRN